MKYGKYEHKRGMFFFLVVFLAAGALHISARASQPENALLGVEVIEDVLPVYVGGNFRDPRPRDEFPPLRVLLSRHRYWAQDGHMDIVVRLDDPDEGANLSDSLLKVSISDAKGSDLSEFSIDPVPGDQFIFYPKLPEGFLGEGVIHLVWSRGEEIIAQDTQEFLVKKFDEPADAHGRVQLRVRNEDAVTGAGVPVTAGVPFPRGVLDDAAHLRLVDEEGDEMPLQVKETARWSKFGSVKWVLCDFKVDLVGESRELYLEYGPDVHRSERNLITVDKTEGFPLVDAGRIRIDQGLWFDAEDDGRYEQVLDEKALSGAFVEHEDGRIYRAPVRDTYQVEEMGAEKVVIRREGWYRENIEDREFCKYVTRYVIHRDSPLMRIFHTWIFTGDSNRDRIANMGWQFALAPGLEREGFLTGFDSEGTWIDGDYLLQYDYEHFDVVDGENVVEYPGGRAAGAATARGNGVRLYFGVKDFWQNYPSELEFADGSLWFHNWPRHNLPAGHTFDKEWLDERGDPPKSSAARYAHEAPDRLTSQEWKLNMLQLRYAHEGTVLDFRLPEEFGRFNFSSPPHWPEDKPESANAQGIARTEEMWLIMAPDNEPKEKKGDVLQGLNEERLRATVDPVWVAASGAFYEMHHQDRDNYPEAERSFELMALSPGRWHERLGMYGMWLHGDQFAWGGVSLDSKDPAVYRALRKAHHGWPYSWVPYARSGDPRLLKAAERATRQLTDATYCHYAGGELKERMEVTDFPRRVGIWNTGPIPWAGGNTPMTRSQHSDIDNMLHSWYLTGYGRGKDTFLSWAEHTKVQDEVGSRGEFRPGPRGSVILLKAWTESYEATFDPWFLVAAHTVALGHRDRYRTGTHNYNTGNREFMRFSGCPDYEEFYLELADRYGDPAQALGGWERIGLPVGQIQAFAWHLTGDEFYLGRAAHYVDWIAQSVYDADAPDYVTGQYTYGHGTVIGTSYNLRHFPLALGAVARAGYEPERIGSAFALRWRSPGFDVVVRKEAQEALNLRLSGMSARFLGYHQAREGETRNYKVVGPDGEIALSGDWEVQKRKNIELPAEAPEGEYRLIKESGFDVPVTEAGKKEVIVLEPGQQIPSSFREGRFWFKVPEGVEEFYAEIGLPHSRGRMSIWGPDGERVWNYNYHPHTHQESSTVRAEVQVGPEQAGRLWLVTVPGHNGGPIAMDPQIPPVFAADRARWFMPQHVDINQ